MIQLDRGAVTGGGTVHTFGTLALGAQTLQFMGNFSTTGGNAGATFGAVTLTGAPLIVVKQTRTSGTCWSPWAASAATSTPPSPVRAI